MEFIGKSVYHVWDVNHISFGNVTEEKKDNNWTWVRINWIGPIPTNIYNSPTQNPETGWYRIDTIRTFKPKEMVATIAALSTNVENL